MVCWIVKEIVSYFDNDIVCALLSCGLTGSEASWAAIVGLWLRFRTARAQRQLLRSSPGNTPANHPPTEACTINSKPHAVQNSGPWDSWLPVSENSGLFAQRAHSAGCAPND